MTRWAIALYESRRRIGGGLIPVAAISILSLVYTSISTAMKGIEDDFLEAFPPAMLELLNMGSFGTVKGFLAMEMQDISWVVLWVFNSLASTLTISTIISRRARWISHFPAR